MSSSSSSSSAAAAAAAPAPKVEQAFREAKLRVGFDKVLQAWRGRADASGGLKDAFPNLYPKYGKQLDALYNTLWQEMHQFMKVCFVNKNQRSATIFTTTIGLRRLTMKH